MAPDDGADLAGLLAAGCALEGEERLDIWPENPGNPGTLRKYRKR
jgi:hypothetical protein